MMTHREARQRLALNGMSFRCTDGEYRVNFQGGHEATAYYTDDLDDAVLTGAKMRWRAIHLFKIHAKTAA